MRIRAASIAILFGTCVSCTQHEVPGWIAPPTAPSPANAITNLVVSPKVVSAARQTRAIITLREPAATDLMVELSVSDGSVTAPASAVVSSGSSTAEVAVQTSATDRDLVVTVTATLLSQAHHATFTVLKTDANSYWHASASGAFTRFTDQDSTVAAICAANVVEVRAGASLRATFAAPAGTALRPGVYNNALMMLSVPDCSGEVIRGVNFIVDDIELGDAGQVRRFVARFEWECRLGGALYGEVRLTNPPKSIPTTTACYR